MTIEQLIQLAQTRLTNLSSQKTSAEVLGDVTQIQRLMQEISQTQETINTLSNLSK